MHKTKGQNTFRFKSFAERVNDIDLRRLALYHIGHENEQLENENETYFHQTLKKWMVLNLTEEFNVFSRKCQRIITLPQLMHQKDMVIDALLERLSTASNLSLQPLLELLYVLARDLREEFYPYFQRVLDRLVNLLNTQDAEQLEWTFVCLAYLFKALKPYLKRNIGVVFNTILPLLDEQRYDEHITNFAVECFSFIARDVRDYKRFLDFVMDTVAHEQVQAVQGCGRVLFEIMRGVKGQFHSTAGEFLEFIFDSLIKDNTKNDEHEKLLLLGEVVDYALQQLLKFIHTQNMSIFWLKLSEVSNRIQHAKQLNRLLPLYLRAASYRSGGHLIEMDVVVPAILKMWEKCMIAKEATALNQLGLLNSKIVLSATTQVTQLDTSRLIKKMLTVEQRDLYATYVLLIVKHPQFELLVLPAVVSHFETHFDFKAIELMSRLVLTKQPLAMNAIQLEHWKTYDIHLKKKETLEKIIKEFQKINNIITNDELSNEAWRKFLLLCSVAPHIKALSAEHIEPYLKMALDTLLKMKDFKNNMQIFFVIFETAIHMGLKFNKNVLTQFLLVISPLIDDLRALNCLDQLLTLNFELLEKDRETLLSQLSSLLNTHQREIRLTAVHCLRTLHSKNRKTTPYDTLFAAALIEPELHNYRQQLLQLQKLEITGELYKAFKEQRYKFDILKFLLGLLYQNFKFVWEPILQLIEQYAKSLSITDFWTIYKVQLERTAAAIAESYQIEFINAEVDKIEHNSITNYLCDIFTINADLKKINLSQQALFNYRNLLWQRLPKFGQLIELKNRELVPLFLNFLQSEYREKLQKNEYTWNLLATKTNDTNLEAEVESDSESELDEEHNDDDDDATAVKNYTKSKSKSKTSTQNKNKLTKFLLQTLQTKLCIFSCLPNPKALYRETELYALYMELLACTNSLLQKQALDCVLAYKSKTLLAFKDHLYAFIDEQKFKDELINFQLNTLNEEQRCEIMPILLRLLYGKMLTRSAQRGLNAQKRKRLVLRFLAQCNLPEIFMFLKMAFGNYAKYIEADINMETIPKLIENDFQLKAVPSAKKLKSMVNLLELIRKEFGGIMGAEFHDYMLKLLIFVGSYCQAVLAAAIENNAMIHPKMPIVFRNVKQAALIALVNFFAHINNYDWQASQMKCLTQVFIWPNIEKLPQDCIHTPTPLLKLLLEWAQQPRLFKYLNQKQSTATQNVIFYYLIELLLNERAKSQIQKPLLAMIEHLLVKSNETEFEYAEISLKIIKPFIPLILQRLKQNFKASLTKRHKIKVDDKQQLNILSMLTTHVEDSETCENLLELLLPLLIAKAQNSANDIALIMQIITTLKNLIKRLNAPETQLLKVAPLFEFVQDVSGRKLLCELILDIASKRLKEAKRNSTTVPNNNKLCEHLKEITRLILMLNAWDKRWLEQPDYDKRLDALKEMAQQLNKGKIELDLGVLVIYNCSYYLRFDKDMGLRDNASEHLRLLIPKLTQQLANDPAQLNFLMNDIIIKLIQRLIRDQNDNIRNEGIRLLGAMARQCATANVIFKELAPLTDEHDEESDFFENLTHLQTQRHGRALLKFCTYAGTLTKPLAQRTLIEFILPLSTRYLLQEKYSGKHALIDAAIEALGVACQLLPWQQYHAILKYYIQKMRRTHDYQKQCVRIVVRILDAYHFDLATEQIDIENLENDLKEVEKIEQNKAEENPENEENVTETVNNAEADLVTALEEEAAEEEDIDVEIAENLTMKIAVLNKPTKLSLKASKKVLITITKILIPTLNRAINEKTQYDTQHKLNRRRVGFEREAEEILRVPIALALVKLMQKLPKQLMENALPGVFMKVCTFLCSPLKSVRMLTRDILKKIILTLGSNYLPLLVEHLQTLLTRGFQVHVLSVTIHGVLDALRDQFQAKDIDNCLGNLLEIALNDIFGDVAAEIVEKKNATQTPEAKASMKSYLVLHIAARNIQEASLIDLLMPFKEHLMRSHARKVIIKIQECFAKIVSGLAENVHISCENLLIFIYGMISESITELIPGTQQRQLSVKEKEKMRRARPDCYIIQPIPQRRMGAINKNVKSNAQANAHILIEFGLELLYIILKRNKLTKLNDDDHQAFLNPLLPLLSDALKSNQIRVITFTLKCFTAIWNSTYELPELGINFPDIAARMFDILKNLSTFGASKQEDNLQLIKSTLKALVALLRQCPQYSLTAEQIDQLVLHIEQDLYESEKQPLSFALLKALIARKVDTPTVHGILKQIAEFSITSQSDYVRNECRGILLSYVMEYSLNKRIDQLIKNFSVQLCYTVPTGRMSAIEFLASIIKRFPQQILSKRAEFLYLSLGTRLVNDEDSKCRKAVAECIESLIMRLEKTDRQRLFEITLLFFEESKKPSVREMAASLCSRFLNVEKRAFMARLPFVLPVIVARLTMNDPHSPGKFVRAPATIGVQVDAEHVKTKQIKLTQKGKLPSDVVAQDSEEAIASTVLRKQRAIDHEIIQMQYCMHKILENCLIEILKLNDETLISHIDELAYTSQRLLAHEHSWVRCNAAKIISQILAQYDFVAIGKRLCGTNDELEGATQWLNFIYADPASDIKSLVLDLCAQMIPGETPQEMIDEMVKIFLLIANMLRNVPFEIEKKVAKDDVETLKINLKWFIGRIRYLINKEIAKAPHCVSMRTALFNLIEGLITIIQTETLILLSPMLLLVLVREMSEEDQQIDLDLRQLALHVGSRLRKAIGNGIYDKLRARAQTTLLMRRAERKKIVAQEKIHDPVRAAKRKAATQDRKKAAKKRKTDVMRGKAEDIKHKLKKRKRKAESGDIF